MLPLAAIYDAASRAEAAQIGGVTRQIGIHTVTAALRGETAELTS